MKRKHLGTRALFLIVLAASFGIGCGEEARDREYYGDLGLTPGGIEIVESGEHKTGWNQANCMGCHVLQNIHRGELGRLIDIQTIYARDGIGQINRSGCLNCHGPNGLDPSFRYDQKGNPVKP
jgi:hypothetical protein